MAAGKKQAADPAADRRASAPHPGPLLRRAFLDVLGVDDAALAEQLGLEPEHLSAMLDGTASIDVETAIRLSRALQVRAEHIMQMQLRADFARARDNRQLQSIGVLRPSGPQPFPAEGYICGRLGRAGDERGGDLSLFFQEDVAAQLGDHYAGFHALWRGDRLRIYDEAGQVVWTGPIVAGLDGHIQLPFVRATEWHAWFAAGCRADLAIGPEHAAFFQRMRLE